MVLNQHKYSSRSVYWCLKCKKKSVISIPVKVDTIYKKLGNLFECQNCSETHINKGEKRVELELSTKKNTIFKYK